MCVYANFGHKNCFRIFILTPIVIKLPVVMYLVIFMATL